MNVVKSPQPSLPINNYQPSYQQQQRNYQNSRQSNQLQFTLNPNQAQQKPQSTILTPKEDLSDSLALGLKYPQPATNPIPDFCLENVLQNQSFIQDGGNNYSNLTNKTNQLKANQQFPQRITVQNVDLNRSQGIVQDYQYKSSSGQYINYENDFQVQNQRNFQVQQNQFGQPEYNNSQTRIVSQLTEPKPQFNDTNQQNGQQYNCKILQNQQICPEQNRNQSVKSKLIQPHLQGDDLLLESLNMQQDSKISQVGPMDNLMKSNYEALKSNYQSQKPQQQSLSNYETQNPQYQPLYAQQSLTQPLQQKSSYPSKQENQTVGGQSQQFQSKKEQEIQMRQSNIVRQSNISNQAQTQGVMGQNMSQLAQSQQINQNQNEKKQVLFDMNPESDQKFEQSQNLKSSLINPNQQIPILSNIQEEQRQNSSSKPPSRLQQAQNQSQSRSPEIRSSMFGVKPQSVFANQKPSQTQTSQNESQMNMDEKNIQQVESKTPSRVGQSQVQKLSDFDQSTLTPEQKLRYIDERVQTISNQMQRLSSDQQTKDLTKPQSRTQQSRVKSSQVYQVIPSKVENKNQRGGLQTTTILESQDIELNNKDPNFNIVYTKIFPDGSHYTGNIQNGQMQGWGRLQFVNGGFYEGEFHQNTMNGTGSLYYNNTQIAFEGQWLNGQFNGQGILYNINPKKITEGFDYRNFNNLDNSWNKFNGLFIKDKKEGQGTLYLTNNEYYIGGFKQDYVDGQGTYFTNKKQKIQGFWKQNKFQ